MPTPDAYIEVNETRILMVGNHEASTWWIAYRARAERVGRVTVLTASIGDLLRVACEDRGQAEWLAEQAIARGVPAAAIRANGPIPRSLRTASGRAARTIEPDPAEEARRADT